MACRGPRKPERCAGQEAAIIVSAPGVVELSCHDDGRACEEPVRLIVTNCTQESLVVDEMSIDQSGGSLRLAPEDAKLTPGASWAHEWIARTEGEYDVVALAHPAHLRERALRSAAARLRVRDTHLEQAREQCRACDGEWGPQGMLRELGCNCRTRDAGKICHDGDECEGACLSTGFDVVQDGIAPHCDASGTCTGRPGLGVPVGRCDERSVRFGCFARVPKGAAKERPVVLPAKAETICID
jgi:hypothetical protein